MRFRYIDPNNPHERAKMPFVLENVGFKGEADSPAGLACLIIGPEYADVDDEEIAWKMRLEALQGFALWLAAFGRKAVVVDGSVPEPVFIPYSESDSKEDDEAPIELRADGDYAMIASLQRAGLLSIYERGSVFSSANSAPARCGECAYFKDGRCGQFDMPVEEFHGCLDGVVVGALEGKKHKSVERAELPPRRVKAIRQAVPA